jgi:putative flavoprotein involved in K+ transport
LTWQHTRGSALIGWVKDDAEFITEQIKAFQETKSRPRDVRIEQRERV